MLVVAWKGEADQIVQKHCSARRSYTKVRRDGSPDTNLLSYLEERSLIYRNYKGDEHVYASKEGFDGLWRLGNVADANLGPSRFEPLVDRFVYRFLTDKEDHSLVLS